jgi:hypothetical protein
MKKTIILLILIITIIGSFNCKYLSSSSSDSNTNSNTTDQANSNANQESANNNSQQTGLIDPITGLPVLSSGKFSGSYETQWGLLTMTQDGDMISGTYQNTVDGSNGVLSGRTIENGNKLECSWTETRVTNAGDMANVSGMVYFTLSDDGKTLNGQWKYSNTAANTFDGTWNGTKKENE